MFGKEALLAELGWMFELTDRRRNYSITEYAMNLTPGKSQFAVAVAERISIQT